MVTGIEAVDLSSIQFIAVIISPILYDALYKKLRLFNKLVMSFLQNLHAQ